MRGGLLSPVVQLIDANAIAIAIAIANQVPNGHKENWKPI